MKDSAKTEKRGRGRPKQYESPADRVSAYRENRNGQRYDIYLSNDANIVMRDLMRLTGLSAPKVLDGVLTGQIKLPNSKG